MLYAYLVISFGFTFPGILKTVLYTTHNLRQSHLANSPPNFILKWTSVSIFQVQLFQIWQRRAWESGGTLTFLCSMCTLWLGKREKVWKQQTRSLCPQPAPMFNPWSNCWTHQKQSLVGRTWLSEVLAYIGGRSLRPLNILEHCVFMLLGARHKSSQVPLSLHCPELLQESFHWLRTCSRTFLQVLVI